MIYTRHCNSKTFRVARCFKINNRIVQYWKLSYVSVCKFSEEVFGEGVLGAKLHPLA